MLPATSRFDHSMLTDSFPPLYSLFLCRSLTLRRVTRLSLIQVHNTIGYSAFQLLRMLLGFDSMRCRAREPVAGVNLRYPTTATYTAYEFNQHSDTAYRDSSRLKQMAASTPDDSRNRAARSYFASTIAISR